MQPLGLPPPRSCVNRFKWHELFGSNSWGRELKKACDHLDLIFYELRSYYCNIQWKFDLNLNLLYQNTMTNFHVSNIRPQLLLELYISICTISSKYHLHMNSTVSSLSGQRTDQSQMQMPTLGKIAHLAKIIYKRLQGKCLMSRSVLHDKLSWLGYA